MGSGYRFIAKCNEICPLTNDNFYAINFQYYQSLQQLCLIYSSNKPLNDGESRFSSCWKLVNAVQVIAVYLLNPHKQCYLTYFVQSSWERVTKTSLSTRQRNGRHSTWSQASRKSNTPTLLRGIKDIYKVFVSNRATYRNFIKYYHWTSRYSG